MSHQRLNYCTQMILQPIILIILHENTQKSQALEPTYLDVNVIKCWLDLFLPIFLYKQNKLSDKTLTDERTVLLLHYSKAGGMSAASAWQLR